MNKYFLMQARQTGKTSKAVYEYLKDPLDTVFVVTNEKNKDYIKDKIGDKNANVLTEEEFLTEHYCASRNYILDEYMFFKHKKDVYEKINSLDPANLFIFSTSDKVYKKDIFDFIFDLKNSLLFKEYTGVKTEEVIKEIEDLIYNFLTDPDTILIDKNYGSPLTFKYSETQLKEIYGKTYDLEILNKYLV